MSQPTKATRGIKNLKTFALANDIHNNGVIRQSGHGRAQEQDTTMLAASKVIVSFKKKEPGFQL
ncbi:hypothetical protein ASB57_01195 [Bordetella sp. N]|nr:hypothetical protein ASB57_01195 [Bordetella sp. N]